MAKRRGLVYELAHHAPRQDGGRLYKSRELARYGCPLRTVDCCMKCGKEQSFSGRFNMIRILCTLSFAVMAGAMVAGCADDQNSGRQRPGYSYENVDMGTPQSGQRSRFDERPPASNTDPYSRSQPGRY
jgi:hypothetical protein